jgi:predicted acetyltransferase
MLELRNLTPDEFVHWLRAESRAHGNRLDHDPEEFRPNFDLDRTIAVFEGDNIVGGAHSHRLEMSIPGATATVAGVSNVAVQPTHRRQGVMTRMMDHQIKDVHERGEPLAALFATESVIYGRFGYGIGSLYERWTIDRQHNGFARPYNSPGRIAFVAPEDISTEFPEIFRRGTLDRPGVFQRAAHRQWYRDSRLPEHRQGGRGGLFFIKYEDEGRVDGYAAYRTGGGTLTVNELVAATREANSALWRFCFDVDLITSTEALKRPVDDPLPWMLADPRRLQRSRRDGLWLRLIDVGDSLELRHYGASDRLVLEVRDNLCPWNDGRFELEGSPEGGSCRTTTASPDLSLSVSCLASTYLGAVAFTTLSQAGLVEEGTPGALLRADRMFAVQHQPWTPHNF